MPQGPPADCYLKSDTSTLSALQSPITCQTPMPCKIGINRLHVSEKGRYTCRCWTQHRIFGFRGFKSIRTPLSVLWPVSGFWQEDTARKWWAATNISVFQSKGPRPMKRRWSMRRPIVTLSNLGLFWQQASYYDDVDCNWLCELNLQWLLPWSHFWLQVSWWHSSMLSMPASKRWRDNF